MSPSLPLLSGLMAVSLLAGLTKGVTGFGGALVMAPLFGLVLPSSQAAALIVLVNCAASLQGWRGWIRCAHWPTVLPLAAIALACTAVGVQLIASGRLPDLHRLIGLSVLAVTALHVLGWRWRHSGGASATLAAGAISGMMTALCGIGGVAAVYYFDGIRRAAASSAEPEQTAFLRANLLAYFMVLFFGAALILAWDGQVGWSQLSMSAWLVPAFAGGVLMGERIYGWLSPLWFQRIVAGLLFCAGMVALAG
ncbi:sulfite exporter TauE/SafE family protein [Herbaspirillum huttiense]|uniref:sulfite exporter TauE/SafE family protein n=1 Tax=Herbaspirillum huttiense TaxID=863372 RepID=UPI0039AF180F